MSQKYLDENGLKYLWSQLSLQDYPNNEALIAIINAIDEVKVSKADLLDLIYPIGSIYITLNSASPSILFGGTWTQIKDTFLLATGDNYNVGTTGGEAEHTLTIEEMPSHNHKLKTDINNPTYNITWPEWFEYTDGWTQQAGETQAPATHTTSVGGDIAHNNMPPYLTVYMWQRTA